MPHCVSASSPTPSRAYSRSVRWYSAPRWTGCGPARHRPPIRSATTRSTSGVCARVPKRRSGSWRGIRRGGATATPWSTWRIRSGRRAGREPTGRCWQSTRHDRDVRTVDMQVASGVDHVRKLRAQRFDLVVTGGRDKPLQATAGMKGKPSGSVALSRAEATARPTERHDGRPRTPGTSPAAPESAFVGICMVIEFAAPGSKATSIKRCSLSQEWVQALGRIKLTAARRR